MLGGCGALIVALLVALVRERRRRWEMRQLLRQSDSRLMSLQREFERFVPPALVEQLTDADRAIVPARRQVTILFADLRGFTAMCDRLDPAVTVTILNGYFARMISAVTRHHGTVTELVGDGLLALFGALEDNPWQALDAVQAAQAMRGELAAYNEELRESGLPTLRFGIGIHGGDVVAGVIGTGGLSKFTVTGDPINIASRVEGLTSQFEVDLLITEDIQRALDQRFVLRPMPLASVKGKAQPIQTYYVSPDAAAT